MFFCETMPLLQEQTPSDILSGRDTMKVDPDEQTSLKNTLTSVGFPSFPNSTMSQILMASQLMAASGLGLQTNPAFFHPGLFATTWATNSPPSPPITTEQYSQALKLRKHNNNNNNNVVSSSSHSELKRRRAVRKLEEITPLSSPTSSTSPPTSTSTDSVNKDPNRDRQFTCGVCKRSFGYKHVLQNHERTHTGEKPFECPECHKKFTRDHHLKTHMRLHTGERPYHCEHCDRQFVQVANLRRHLRVHTGERPYVCEHCQARFSDSNQLKAHILIHTNEKPFACERCQSRFRRRHHLLHHKCGAPDKEVTAQILEESEEIEDLRPRHILEPLIRLPLRANLPEQTEPEDLSMSTGIHSHHSHSSGDSTLSRSPSSREYLDYDDTDPDDSAAIFLQKRPPPAHS